MVKDFFSKMIFQKCFVFLSGTTWSRRFERCRSELSILVQRNDGSRRRHRQIDGRLRSTFCDFAFDRNAKVLQASNHRLASFVVGDAADPDHLSCDVESFEAPIKVLVDQVDEGATDRVRRQNFVSGDNHFRFRIEPFFRRILFARHRGKDSSGQEKEGRERCCCNLSFTVITLLRYSRLVYLTYV